MKAVLLAVGLVVVPAGQLLAAVPKVPANFAAASPLVGTVEVTWNDVADETSFELLWGPFPPGPTNSISFPANATVAIFPGLSAGTSHHFQVRACNLDGCSGFTGVVGQTPDGSSGLPAVPVNFAVASTLAGTGAATWDDVFNETSYEVLWGPFPPGPTNPVSLPANTTFAAFPGLSSGVSHHFKIRACNGAGCSAYTDVVGKTPDGSDECWLSQQVWHANGTATISYVLGGNVPTTWRVWAVGSFGFVQILSRPIPAVSPVATGDLSFAFPPFGVVGFLSALTTPAGGLRCSDFDKVSTGSSP